jgi:hypothetical protein
MKRRESYFIHTQDYENCNTRITELFLVEVVHQPFPCMAESAVQKNFAAVHPVLPHLQFQL